MSAVIAFLICASKSNQPLVELLCHYRGASNELDVTKSCKERDAYGRIMEQHKASTSKEVDATGSCTERDTPEPFTEHDKNGPSTETRPRRWMPTGHARSETWMGCGCAGNNANNVDDVPQTTTTWRTMLQG